MGLFWNLIQQCQISDQHRKSETLENRVAILEEELRNTQDLLYKTLKVLEEYTDRDINGDGRIGY
ncbi:hypothetical protein [Dethiobacter alkaliphilus]|uniref:hypothetical protein n=1 Tax=Dethiobacter alkaliphilus TaxID=427926 RepID=UPI0022272400|nr:hypothetical protein [Dethiobacter alkaliphilus]MCW3489754.1 hypothetical protein [Dethiobacter alkaliphilus]